jgi:alanyl-tRNA synthetase
VATARHDYTVLAEAGGLLSSHIWDIPQQVRKVQDESRASRKEREHLMEELADLYAARLLGEAAEYNGRKFVVRTFPDRDLAFIKLMAQRLTRQSADVIAFLGTTSDQPALVFAQSAGQPFDMGALMKEILAHLGGRGGGSKNMAQGGPAKIDVLEAALSDLATRLRG